VDQKLSSATPGPVKQRILVWDIPVRLFHWLLAGGFLSAYYIAKFLGEDSTAFPYHAMLGLTLGLMVLLRLVWGIIGTRWARFSELLTYPGELIAYFRGIFSSRGKEYTGHNPATRWTVLIMFALVLALGWTGYQTAAGGELESVHGILANILLAVSGVHVCGVVFHVLRKRDGIILSMVHGHKQGDPGDAIKGSHALAGVAFLALIGFFFGSLATSFNPATGSTKWPLISTRLLLGESEGEGYAGGANEQQESSESDGD